MHSLYYNNCVIKFLPDVHLHRIGLSSMIAKEDTLHVGTLTYVSSAPSPIVFFKKFSGVVFEQGFWEWWQELTGIEH